MIGLVVAVGVMLVILASCGSSTASGNSNSNSNFNYLAKRDNIGGIDCVVVEEYAERGVAVSCDWPTTTTTR